MRALLDAVARYPKLASFAIGLTLPLAFAPFRFWWYAPVLTAAAAAMWAGCPAREAAARGFAFGAGGFLTGTYWLYISITIFGEAPPWLSIFLMLGLVLIMALYYALAAALVVKLTGPNRGRLLWVLPAAWVLAEWLRGWLASGFPWLALGYGQTEGPLSGLVPLLGVYGVSAVVVLLAAAALVAVRERGRIRLLAVALMPVLPGLGLLFSSVDWTEPAGPPLKSSLIQGAVSQDRKWLPEELAPTLLLYRRLTLAQADSDVIVWPEVAVPALALRVESYLRGIDRIAEERGQDVLLGIMDYDPEHGSYSNSILQLGEGSGIYRKRHLVPFGEYFPVPAFVREWMRLMSLPYRDTTPGPAKPDLLEAAGQKLALSICYEDAFGAEQLYAFPDATLLVNVSNDAWFGRSIAPHQHLQIAQMRSLEAGRWQLRATNTGITAFIDPRGRVHSRAPQFQPTALTAVVQPRTGLTPYAASGNSPLVILCLVLLAGAAATVRGAGAQRYQQPDR